MSDDICQCVCFVGEGPDAKLCGVKYLVSEKIFEGLPDEEKKLWCSIDVPLKLGFQCTLDLDDSEDAKQDLQTKAKMFAKDVVTWPADSELPLGPPLVMVVPQDKNDVKPEILSQLKEQFGDRIKLDNPEDEDLEPPKGKEHPNVDFWVKTGKALQTTLTEVTHMPEGHDNKLFEQQMQKLDIDDEEK